MITTPKKLSSKSGKESGYICHKKHKGRTANSPCHIMALIAFWKCTQEHAEEIKGKVCSLLKRTPRPNKNLSPIQTKAIKSLKKRDNIVILRVDKGNATVVMEKEEYHKKCLALLQPPTYMPLLKYPTTKVEKRITETLKQLHKEKVKGKTLKSSDPTIVEPHASMVSQRYTNHTIHRGLSFQPSALQLTTLPSLSLPSSPL